MLSKIVVLLDHLEPGQVLELKKHVLTKTYADSDIFRVFDHLATSVKKKDEFKSPDYIHEKILPKSSKKTVANYLSLLYNWAEEWMALEIVRDEEYTLDHLAQRWLNRNGLYHLADQTFNRIEKGISEENKIDLHHTWIRALALFDQVFSNNPARDQLPLEKYEEMARSFRQCMKAKLQVINAELYNWGDINNYDFRPAIEANDDIIDRIQHDETTETMEFVIKAMSKNDVNSFLKLKDILFNDRLVKGSRLFMITTRYMHRLAIRFWNMGLIKDPQIMHDLLDFGMKSGAYFTRDRLQATFFHNLVMQYCQVADYEGVEKFIDQWMDHVTTEDAAATKALAMAQNCFYHQRCHEIHLYTGRFVFPTFNQKNLAQGLHLIAAFENRKQERQIYETALASSQNFLKRNQQRMSKHLYNSYRNLIAFIKAADADPTAIPHPDSISPLLYRKWCMELFQVSANR